MKSIVLLNCYFGDLPWYFGHFLLSCRYNETINFIIYTNSSVAEYIIPENVEIINFSLVKFNNLASEKLNLKIEVKNAYKLCDFKPAYGVIFADYVNNYDFWGITDIDIIFGCIREFFTNDLLKKYELISVRKDYITGSFLVFKNTPKLINLFYKSKDYKMVFLSDKHYCFDECNFVHSDIENGKNINDVKTEIQSMEYIVSNNDVEVWREHYIIEGRPGNLIWKEGILKYKNIFEVLFYHLISFKDNTYTKKNRLLNTCKVMYISKHSITHRKVNHEVFKFLHSVEKYLKICLILLNFLISYFASFLKWYEISDFSKYETICGRNSIYIFKNNDNYFLRLHGYYYREGLSSYLFKSIFGSGNRFFISDDPFSYFDIRSKEVRRNYLNGSFIKYYKKS